MAIYVPEFTADLTDPSRCVSTHWSLPVQCVMPRAHPENWHEGWHPDTANRLRYRRAFGSYLTEQLVVGVWQSLNIPAPNAAAATPPTDQQLRDSIAQVIRTDLKKAIPPVELYPGGHRHGGMGRTEYDLADAALAVVQPELDRLAAELGRARAAWHSARRRANHNHLAGQRFPGGAVREALVYAGYINRQDTVASAVEKINDAPRKWYVSWLTHNLTRLGSAYTATVAQAKRQARRAEAAEAELGRVRAELATATAAIDRTTVRMQAYSAVGSGGVNPRQVINLLSLTWPDGNYEALAASPSA